MDSLLLYAPAKINYLLDVISKRADGYHELRMIMQRVNICDKISISLNKSSEIRVICSSKNAPGGQDNIAWKAAKILLEHSHSKNGVTIEILKKIPVAAGLGGGSSDAATVLMGLNQLLQLDLSDVELMKIGCNLGADVPFFIFKETALAEGIGEKLTAIKKMPNCFILLVNPGLHVSTAWVYRSLQLTNKKEMNRLPEFFESIEQLASILSNDLEIVTIAKYPIIAQIKSCLLDLGAVGSMMSGSGSTVFGIFKSYDAAEIARKKITEGNDWFAATVETI